MNNRRLLFVVMGVALFAAVVLVWYFFYTKPLTAPSLGSTNNPLPNRTLPVRFQFLNWGDEETGNSTTEVTDPSKNPLVRVWKKPSVGQKFTIQETLKEITATTTSSTSTIEIKKFVRASSTILIFVDRETGYIYGYPVETGEVFQITNTIIPGVYDAHFFENGKKVVIQYIDTERNTSTAILATVPPIKTDSSPVPLINTTNLPSLVTSVAVNGRDDRASYIVTTSNGSSIYTITGNDSVFVDSSPFKEWTLSYGGENLFVTTKPSAYITGVTAKLPFFSLQTNERTGLMSTPNNGGDLLNSMWSSGGLITFITTLKDETVLPIKTLASKCSWGEDNLLVCGVPRSLPKESEGMPDDWFQGRVLFSDDLYSIDKNTNETFPLYVFKPEEGDFDITNIVILKTNDLFSFTRKQDGSLWLLNTNLIKED